MTNLTRILLALFAAASLGLASAVPATSLVSSRNGTFDTGTGVYAAVPISGTTTVDQTVVRITDMSSGRTWLRPGEDYQFDGIMPTGAGQFFLCADVRRYGSSTWYRIGCEWAYAMPVPTRVRR